MSPLIRKKFLQFLPGMLLTNVSTLILINVDGVVIGNMVGSTAFAAVAVIAPVVSLIGVLVGAFGGFSVGVALGQAIGSNDLQKLRDCYRSGMVLATLLAVAVAVAEVPLFRLLIEASGTGVELQQEAWAYSKGIMIAMVIGVFSTFGTYVLIANGRTRSLLYLSVFEGVVNLVADVVFVKCLAMGTVGAGYGTAVANAMRLAATVFVLWRETDVFRNVRLGRARSILEIMGFGRSTFVTGVVWSVSAYFMNRLIVHSLGDQGMVMKAVGGFSLTIANAVYGGVGLSLGPLLALFAGEGSYQEMRRLFQFGVRINIALVSLLSLVLFATPVAVCRLNGIAVPPDGTYTVVRFYCLFFVFEAVNSMINLCLINLKRQLAATVLSLMRNALLLLPFAWLFSLIDGRLLFCGYALASAVVMTTGWIVVRSMWKRLGGGTRRISFDLVPENVSPTVEKLMKELSDLGVPPARALRIGLAVEETSAYIKSARRGGEVHLHVRLGLGQDKVTVSVLDDGERVGLTDRINALATDLVYNNIGMINAISSKVNYQYVMNMNFTTLEVK